MCWNPCKCIRWSNGGAPDARAAHTLPSLPATRSEFRIPPALAAEVAAAAAAAAGNPARMSGAPVVEQKLNHSGIRLTKPGRAEQIPGPCPPAAASRTARMRRGPARASCGRARAGPGPDPLAPMRRRQRRRLGRLSEPGRAAASGPPVLPAGRRARPGASDPGKRGFRVAGHSERDSDTAGTIAVILTGDLFAALWSRWS